MEEKFYLCTHCGNVVLKIIDSKVPLVCCGQKMQELVTNTVEASKEKHIPVVSVNGRDVHVEVGSVIHPMTEEHFIEWIYLKTSHRNLVEKCSDKPIADFVLNENEMVITVYAYCNLHGLWAVEI